MSCKEFSKKKFIFGNGLYLFALITLIAVSSYMKVSGAFTKGLLTGFISVWVIYLIWGLRELRKPTYSTDERFQLIIAKASSLTLGIIILLLAFFIILLHSNWLVITISLKSFCVILLYTIMILHLTVYLIINKLS